MPEISGLLLLLLFFGFSFLRKKAQQEASKAKNSSKPQTFQPGAMPAFPESAPAMPVRTMSVEKPRTVQKKAVPMQPSAPKEGQTWEWQQEKRETPLPNPVPAAQPKNGVVPVFTKDALIQGIVMHEILTRPKHAVGPYLTDYPPRV